MHKDIYGSYADEPVVMIDREIPSNTSLREEELFYYS